MQQPRARHFGSEHGVSYLYGGLDQQLAANVRRRVHDPVQRWTCRSERGEERGLIGKWAERAKGWTRLRDWLDALVERGISPNIGSFLGGGTLREYAKGRDMGAPTPDELQTMRRVMAEASHAE